ncbi:TetR/AcrR family transcriptional regulator [Dyella jiangningensis]|uniref:TetR family transcriptional regulator n=1 Tax=Dyella jiangningensis TaxID=1379159 RepID=A0A328PAY8_9GAMM|nr:TetR/AcrR family transcriptional regulator [Dyella jiangningensis]RAO78311.1 TetR family transcriptional regulator [Dyella jiangningensis]
MPSLTTSEKILKATRTLIENEGAPAVSIRRIAAEVGITPMAIYRHFEDLAAIMRAVNNQLAHEVATAWATSGLSEGIKREYAPLGYYLDYALAHPHLFDYVFGARQPHARRYPEDFRDRQSPAFNVMVDSLAAGIRDGLLAKGDPYDYAMSLWAHAHGLVSLYRAGRFSYEEAEFRAFFMASMEIMFRGMRA